MEPYVDGHGFADCNSHRVGPAALWLVFVCSPPGFKIGARNSDRMGTHVEDFDTWRIPVLPNQWVRCHYANRHLFVGIARHRRRFCTSYLPNSHSWIAARE